MSKENESGLLKDIRTRIKKSCLLLGVNEDYYRFLSKVQKTVVVSLPLMRDNGELEMYKGYLAEHATIMGPAKGGLRISPDITQEDIQAFAIKNSFKSALIGLPLSGGKTAIKADPRILSNKEIERLVRRFTASIINQIGPDKHILSPELNTDEQTMAWVADTYSMGMGKPKFHVCTGKPPEMGGIIGRDKAVGWGVGYILKYYANRKNEDIRSRSIAIQGIGHVGRSAAIIGQEYGARIVAISDKSCGVYKPEGLDLIDVINYKKKNGQLKGYPRAEIITNKELLSLKVDVLIPCATHGQITKDNADDINARLILEGANGPITMDADDILDERKVPIIPDIIANTGGIIASYFEWVNDLSQLRWSADRIARELEHIIVDAFARVYDKRHKDAISYREAAYELAIQRLVKAIEFRGIYP
ncbi:MAG: Glu/Leu/Phe/Val family dehydrogenase [Promethearchaeota archaeon]